METGSTGYATCSLPIAKPRGTSCPSRSSAAPSPGSSAPCWRKRPPSASAWCGRLCPKRSEKQTRGEAQKSNPDVSFYGSVYLVLSVFLSLNVFIYYIFSCFYTYIYIYIYIYLILHLFLGPPILRRIFGFVSNQGAGDPKMGGFPLLFLTQQPKKETPRNKTPSKPPQWLINWFATWHVAMVRLRATVLQVFRGQPPPKRHPSKGPGRPIKVEQLPKRLPSQTGLPFGFALTPTKEGLPTKHTHTQKESTILGSKSPL